MDVRSVMGTGKKFTDVRSKMMVPKFPDFKVPKKCSYWGDAAPQTPRYSWGASSAPDPLAGSLQPPVPPCIPRGSASRALHFFWYQDLGTKILVPRSWYQDLGNKKKRESPRGGASRYAGGHGGLQAPRQGVWGAGSPPGTAGGLDSVKTILWNHNHLPTTFNHLQPTTFSLPFLGKR